VSALTCTMVDAVLDTLDEDADPTAALVALVEDAGAWDWQGDEYQPDTRVTVIESTGAWWMIGSSRRVDRARRCATKTEAEALADAFCGGAR
jgi:hypothetical protein